MNRTINIKIDEENNEKTIYSFLKEKGYSKQVIVELKKQHRGICLNDVFVHANDKLRAGDILTLSLNESESSEIEPVDMPISIVYEDEDLLIVNKPADMSTIPSMNHHMDSLANAVCSYYAKQGENFVFRAINRLDRNTTGLVLIAKNLISAAFLSGQQRNGEIDKTYIALVEGSLIEYAPFPYTIDAPIARCNESLITREVNFEKGERAVTHFELLEQMEDFAAVSVKLDTGRTHQIRVHFSYLGHPLLGDDIYGGSRENIKRHALHCNSLSFRHPITGKKLNIQADIPTDMEKLWYNKALNW